MAELLGLVARFSGDVLNLVCGNESFESLLQLCRPAYSQFKADISATKLIFCPYTNPAECNGSAMGVCPPQLPIQPKASRAVTPTLEAFIPGPGYVPNSRPVKSSKPMYLEDVREHIESYVVLPHVWSILLMILLD